MITEKQDFIFQDFKLGDHDINLVTLNCDLYPNLEMRVGDSGEIEPHGVARSDKKPVDLYQLVDTEGNLIYPQNLFLTYVARNRQSASTISQGLLMFTRWLQVTNRSYRDIYADPEEGVAWKFAEFLVRSIRSKDNEEIATIEVSTAKTYMRVIVNFYKWLNREGILLWSNKMKPFDFTYKRVARSKNRSEIDMLSHTKRNSEIVVQSATVMNIFPKGSRTPPHRKLKPLPDDQLDILTSYINNKSYSLRERLMIQLGYSGGLRVEEVVSLNEGAVYQPQLGEKECKLSLLVTAGMDLKGDVSRTTIIPAALMSDLFDYKISSQRHFIINKLSANQDDGSPLETRLFLSVYTKTGAISKNTLQSYWSDLRSLIQIKHKDWYYKFHDLRSTFATNWLLTVTINGSLSVDFYFNELKSLLGHSESTDTMKYINFHKEKTMGIESALRRNKETQEAIKKHG